MWICIMLLVLYLFIASIISYGEKRKEEESLKRYERMKHRVANKDDYWKER